MTWRQTRLKFLADRPIQNGLGEAGGEDNPDWPRYVRTTDIAGPRELRDDVFASLPPDVAHKALLQAGDLLMTAAGATIGKSVLYLDRRPACFAGYLVRFRAGHSADPCFISYWTQSLPYWNQIRAGRVISTIENFSASKYQNLRLSIPPLAVQRAIADYLDGETARIDALIAAKRRMVELLDERRTSLRDHAFASKPGWRLKRLLAGPMAYGVLVPEFVEGGTGVPMIRTYNLSPRGCVDHGDIAEIPELLAKEYRRTSLCQGDVILSVVGSMGRSAVVGPDEQGFNLNRPLARIRLRPNLPSRLLWHWTQTTHFMGLAKLATGGGTAQPTLNLGDLANFAVGLPQSAELWPGILRNLEETCEQIADTEKLANRQIALLQERRQALITAAVTGQLDIPEAA